jgi:GNAT superfamily N-acetyltransferase
MMMAERLVRPAVLADLPAIERVGVATGLTPGWQDYYLFVLTHGLLLVAGHNDEIIGFVGTAPVGALTMVTDLFVRPDRQSLGVGAALLAAALPSSGLCVASSKDVRALARYTKAGMTARWPLYYLRGEATCLAGLANRIGRGAGPLVVDYVTPARAEVLERRITGVERADAYRYWATLPEATGLSVSSGDTVLGAGVAYRHPETGAATVEHFATSDRPVDVLLAALAHAAPLAEQSRAAGQIAASVPAAHAGTLIEAGLRIVDWDVYCSDGHDPSAQFPALSPGLL